ncbi:lipoprotein [Actinoplanes sp. NPDC023801]|uniref:lipoprotein n=1 Tax=Actinoplanes sp. NPDC023801 TaxID=3154595 RepID=UPI0033F41FA7
MNIPAAVGLAVILTLTGCGSDKAPVAQQPPASAAPASSAPGAAPAAAEGELIGAKGSACPMPLSFRAAAGWKPSAVDVKSLGELAALAKIGDFTVVCEIDAKPAGSIGFIRVHVAKGLSGLPREHLASFVKADGKGKEVSGAVYSDVQIGGGQAAEVTWEVYSAVAEQRTRYTAFALNTGDGAVVVRLAPFDEGEHAGMLPAYELAKQTVKAA